MSGGEREREREGPQPRQGRLVLVATPIGNLGDLSPRASATLAEADRIYCEDTRRTRGLLSAAGIAAGGRLSSLHAHNERTRIPEVLGRLDEGQVVAVVTDAGTPAISDPGGELVAAAAQSGHVVQAVPGPSAVLAALVVSGLPTERFRMEGFLPRKGGERRRRLERLAAEEATTIVLEAPGRLSATLGDLLAACGDRPVAVARELTKLHEEVWRGQLAEADGEFARRSAADTVRGEVVIVLGGRPATAGADVAEEDVRRLVGDRLASGDGVRQAAAAAASALGVPRRRAYQVALELRPEP